MIFYLILLLVILLATYYFKSNSKNLPPGPWNLPIIGYLPWLDPVAPYKTLMTLSGQYGSVYGLYLGNIYTVVLTDPKIIRKVLAKDETTGRAPLFLTHGLMKGYGLICSEGSLWKDQRRFVYGCLRQLGAMKIGPQKQKMEAFILEHALDFVNYIKNQNTELDLNPLIPLRHNLGSAINLIVFGKCWPRNDKTWLWLQNLQEEGTKLIGIAGPINFLPFLRFLPKYKKTINFLSEGLQKTHSLYKEVIVEQNKVLKKLLNENPDYEPSNILHAFLMEKEKRKNTSDVDQFYNDTQFHYLLADLFGAGLDTTLTTLSWYLIYLSINEEIQEKIRAELHQISNNKALSLEDIQFCPLLEASIAETQRIRSVVPVGIPHGSLSDLKILDYDIPKGAMIVPLQWGVHMDKNAWTNPDKFDPMRFINDEGKFYKPEAFMPFQTGKRMCIGDELARMILVLFTSTILSNFKFKLKNPELVNLEGICGITLTPKEHEIVFTAL